MDSPQENSESKDKIQNDLNNTHTEEKNTDDLNKTQIYQKYIDDYFNEKFYSKKLWELYANNVLIDDFKYTTRAALALIFIPALTNIALIFRPNTILKTPIRISTVLGCFFNFQYNFHEDFKNLMQKDTIIGNKARLCFQNLSKTDVLFQHFGQQTLEVFSKYISKIELLTIHITRK